MTTSVRKKIPVIALTGGPCAGKTTLSAALQQHLGNLGKKVFFLPEAATLLINAGITPWEFVSFQKHVLWKIIDDENRCKQIAKEHPAADKVIITDRGAPEGMAYVGEKEFRKLLKKEKLELTQIRDGRYDAVIFMRSAAVGAEEFYTTTTNEARKESVEEARVLDKRTENAWLGHPHLRIIENGRGGFEEKKHNTLAAVCSALGIPEPLEIERKYLIAQPDLKKFPVPLAEIDITQYYLRGGGRIRARGQFGAYTYYFTVKHEVRPGVRAEVERQISEREFISFTQKIDAKHFNPVVKKRYCFVWEGQYFELDVLSSPKTMYLLELELVAESQLVRLPPFIQVVRDVTIEKGYSNREIARKKRVA